MKDEISGTLSCSNFEKWVLKTKMIWSLITPNIRSYKKTMAEKKGFKPSVKKINNLGFATI